MTVIEIFARKKPVETPEEAGPPERRPVYPELLQVADILEEHGWTQGTYWDNRGRMCLVGAWMHAKEECETWVRDENWDAPYNYALSAFKDAVIPDTLVNEIIYKWGCQEVVEAWNDEDGRTMAEVIAALRRVGMNGK